MKGSWFNKRILALCAVALALLGLVALLGFFSSRPPPPTPLPNPNGYDDFLQAAASLTGDVGNSSTFDQDMLREFVAANAEPLRLLRLGLTRHCSVPTDEVMTNFPATINNLARLKQLAWLLADEGRLAELESRPADAARSYLNALHFGNEVSRGGFLINRLVGIACEALGGSPLAALSRKLNCEQVLAVVPELEKLDRWAVTWDEVEQNEARFRRYQLRKGFNPITWVMTRWQGWKQRKLGEQRHNRLAAHLRLLTVELALHCYQTEHGRGPDRLDQLVPGHLKRVPLDPFSGQPFIYRVSGTNWLLYSVGADGVDDGGKAAGRSASSQGDLLYDSQW